MRLVFAAALAALSIAACSAAGPSPAPPSVPAAPSATPGAAVDTDALVAAAAANDGQLVRVKGFFLAAADKASLCSIVLESYPPQCGGGTVRLTGEVPAEVLAALDSTTEPGLNQATWGWVEVTGTFSASGADGQPTVALSAIRVAAP